jgi:hypothetical protein
MQHCERKKQSRMASGKMERKSLSTIAMQTTPSKPPFLTGISSIPSHSNQQLTESHAVGTPFARNNDHDNESLENAMNYKTTDHTLTRLVTLARTARTLLYDIRDEVTSGSLQVATGEHHREEFIHVSAAIDEVSNLLRFMTTIPEITMPPRHQEK